MALTTEQRKAARKARRLKAHPSDERAAEKVIKSIHAAGSRPVDPSMLTKASFKRGTVKRARAERSAALRKSLGTSAWWNTASWRERRDRLRKGVGLPGEDDNIAPETQPNTIHGAVNDWHDIPLPSQAVEPIASFTDTRHDARPQ